MAEVIVSGNLNSFGNAGQFETDRSTWGFGDTANYEVTRTSAFKTAGLYAALVKALDASVLPTAEALGIGMASFTPEGGKKYLAKAQVRVPSGTPIADGAALISFKQNALSLLVLTQVSQVNKTVTQATDAFVQVEARYTCSSNPFALTAAIALGLMGAGGSENNNINGLMYVDQLEVYEYIETEDPEPPPPTEEPEPTDEAFLSKNPITHEMAADAGWDLLTNPRLYADVRVEDVADSTTYASKLKVALPPDADGNVVFYLNEAFGDCFAFNAPTLNQATIARLTDRIKRFKVYTGALEALETTPGVLTANGPHVVLWGGIDKFNWPTLAYLETYVATNKKFLTWAPVIKQVDRQQEDYLNFWIYSDTIINLQLQLKVYFDDDTNETDIVTTLEAVQNRGLYQIPAGPANSGALLVNPAKTATKYELTLLDQDDAVISETRTYLINQVSHPLARYFMFLNSLGAFEVLRFTGQQATKAQFARDVVQKFLPHNYSPSDGEFAQNSITRVTNKSIGSGYVKGQLAEEWHEYLQDFIGSPIIYDVTDGKRYPVVVVGGEWGDEDQNYERFIRIEARDAYNNNSYTPSNV